MKKYIGVDLGGTTVKLGLFDENGALLEKWEIPTRTENGGKDILSDIAGAILGKLEERKINKSEVGGAGIGIPGSVMPDGYVPTCVNLGWKDLYPAAELEKLLNGIPVKGGNDANVAALGEQWQGCGKGHSSIAMVTLGTGVGCGIILNGEIVVGSRGMGGELGHVVVNPKETERCNCGNKGCLEQYASATGIVRVARRRLASGDEPSVLRALPAFTAKDVVDAAKAGDRAAEASLDESMDYLARGLAFISHVVDPELFAIGGGVSKAGEYLLSKIRTFYEGYIWLNSKKAQIMLAELGNDAGIYGAARLVFPR